MTRIKVTVDDNELYEYMDFAQTFKKGHFAFLDGVLWVDLSMEQFYTHNQIKEQIGRKLGTLIEEGGLGRYGPDGMLLSHPATGLSTVPDGLFISYTSLQSGRVRPIRNARNVGVIEWEGTPEMVLEVLSDSSEEKDTVILPDTKFPMRGDLAKREPEILAAWDKTDLYGRVLASRKDAPLFVFHDGAQLW